MKECAVPRAPKPSDKALMEGVGIGVREIRKLEHQDLLFRLKKWNEELSEIIRLLEVIFEEEGGG